MSRAEELLYGADPARFARERLGLAADARQEEALGGRARRLLLNCTRQWGKSTVTAARAVHEAYFYAGSLVLVVSPSLRQSGEFVRKAERFLRKLGVYPRGDGDNAVSVLLPNGSRIVGLPGEESTVRGFSAVNLLLIDEASRVADEMYRAVRPMLAVGGGSLWLMSTPRGKRGFFWEEWSGGGEGWTRLSVPAAECPRITAEFLEEERRTLGERWFGQEYGCEFVEDDGQLFPPDLLEEALEDYHDPLLRGR